MQLRILVPLLLFAATARAAPEKEGDPASLTSPGHDRDWPVVAGKLQLASWDKTTATIYSGCLGDHAKSVGATPGKEPWLSAHARSAECLTAIRAEKRVVCLPPSDTQCRDYDWIAGWCGQESRRLAGSNAAWRCTAVMEPEAQRLEADQGRTDVLRPARVFGPNGEEPSYLEGAEGVRSPATVPTQTLQLAPIGRLVSVSTRLMWNLNGARVASCSEYAWERNYDVNELLAQGEAMAAPGRYYHQQLFTRTPRPLVDSAGDWAVKDRSGAAVSGPQSIRNTSSPHPIRRSRNLYHELHHRYDNDLRGYASADVEKAWLTEGLEAYTDNLSWHRELGTRLAAAGYTDDQLEWLRERQDALDVIHRDYQIADDLLQRAMNGTIGCPLAGPLGPNGLPQPCQHPVLQSQVDAYRAIRDAKWVVLDAAIQEGFLLGCIVTGPPQWPDQLTSITPCDWAPSRLADAVNRGDGGRARAAQLTCEREVGGGGLDNAVLHARALPTSAVFAIDGEDDGFGFTAGERQTLDTQRATLLATDPTLHTGAFDAYLVALRAYYAQLVALGGLDANPQTGLSRSKTAEVDGGNQWFGVNLVSSSSSGLRPAQNQNAPDLCTPGGELAAHTSYALKLGSMKLDLEALATFVGMIVSGENPSANGEAPPDPTMIPLATTGPGPVSVSLELDPFDGSVSAGNELVYHPDGSEESNSSLGFDSSMSLIFKLTIQFPMGPLTGKLTIGASAQVGVALSRRASLTIGPLPPTTGTPQQLQACREYTQVLRVAFTPQASVDGFLSFAAGVSAGPVGIYVGIRGTVNLISVMLPVNLHLETIGSFGLPNTVTTGEYDVTMDNDSFWEGYWSALAGRISVFLEVDLWVVTVTLFEWVVVEWAGKTERFEQSDDAPPPPVKLCRIHELRSIFHATEAVPESCNCVIRPAADCPGQPVVLTPVSP